MGLRQKTLIAVVGGSGILVTILVVALAAVLWQFSIAGATRHAQTTAEMARVALNEAMLNGATASLGRLLTRLAETQGLASIRVVRSAQVVEQFGPGARGPQQLDEIEGAVLASAAPDYRLVSNSVEPTFRATIPYIADTRTEPNCLTCHQAPEGSVLGAISIEIGLGEARTQAMLALFALTVVILLSVPALLLLLRYLYQPVVYAAEEVEAAVDKAATGDFSARAAAIGTDEAGRIAGGLNRLMELLEQGLQRISTQVSELIQYNGNDDGNLMKRTTQIVGQLVEGAHFKQAIEEDETTSEVYGRLAGLIRQKFGVERCTVYEVDEEKHRLVPVVLDGELKEENRWCDPQILIRPEACRVRRTGHKVDSFTQSGICTMFAGKQEDSALEHLCLPILQSGGVGSVVQLVAPRDESAKIVEQVPFLAINLREAAPVLEAKRLMQTLRESTLRDAMTGLYNRRFLEEYVETLVARTERNRSHISLLMLDLDYFKKVNDTYGHEAGDKVLVELARRIRQSVRSSDLTIRFGGEEFLVLLHDTDAEGAMIVAEKIRVDVETMRVTLPGQSLQKTISIGVADFPADGDSFWQVLKYADVALYAAKEAGRNQVKRFEPELWDGHEGEF
jgi:diguanylate cyclase (GGDEF)-like protein